MPSLAIGMSSSTVASLASADEDVVVVGGDSLEVVKPVHRVAYKCEWKIRGLPDHRTEIGASEEVVSDAVGFQLVKFAVGFVAKKQAIRNCGNPEQRQEIVEGDNLHCFIRVEGRGEVHCDILDYSIEIVNSNELLDGAPTLLKQEQIESLMYLSELDQYTDPSGTLTVRGEIEVRNTPELAYDLASIQHAARLQLLASMDAVRTKTEYRMVDVRVPESMAVGKDGTGAVREGEVPYMSLKIVRGLICLASPVVAAMLNECSGGDGSQADVISVREFPFAVVALFVSYVKKGPSAVNADSNLAQLARMANQFGVTDLFKLCVSLMLQSINKNSVLDYYEVGYDLDVGELKDACVAALDAEPWGTRAGKTEFWSKAYDRYGKDVMGSLAAQLFRGVK